MKSKKPITPRWPEVEDKDLSDAEELYEIDIELVEAETQLVLAEQQQAESEFMHWTEDDDDEDLSDVVNNPELKIPERSWEFSIAQLQKKT